MTLGNDLDPTLRQTICHGPQWLGLKSSESSTAFMHCCNPTKDELLTIAGHICHPVAFAEMLRSPLCDIKILKEAVNGNLWFEKSSDGGRPYLNPEFYAEIAKHFVAKPEFMSIIEFYRVDIESRIKSARNLCVERRVNNQNPPAFRRALINTIASQCPICDGLLIKKTARACTDCWNDPDIKKLIK